MVIIGGRAHSIEDIRKVGEGGYPFAEIDMYDPGTVMSGLDELLRLKERHNIYYLAHYPNEDDPMNPEVLSEKFLPRLEELFELSEKLKIAKGTLHFWIDKRYAPEEILTRKMELLKKAVAGAVSHGITLCIENLSERHESFERAFSLIPGLRMTMDIGHGELLARRNTSFEFMEHCFDRIAHIHMHDNNGGTKPADDLHLPLGKGRVDYRGIIALLKRKGYRSTVTMEVKPEEMRDMERKIKNEFLSDPP